MTTYNRETIKGYFKTGKIPTEQQYASLVNSALYIEDSNSGSIELTGSLLLTGSLSHIGTNTIISPGGGSTAIYAFGDITSSQTIKSTHLSSSTINTQGIVLNGSIGVTGDDITITSGSLNINHGSISVGHYISASAITSSNFNLPSGSGNVPALRWGGDTNPLLHEYIFFGSEQTNNYFYAIDHHKFNSGYVVIGNISPFPATEPKLAVNGDIATNSHITASGNISSSGTIIADNFTSTGGDAGGINFTDGVIITGNVTASNNISASGNIYGDRVIGNRGDFSTVLNATTGSFSQLESTKFIGSRPIVTLTSNQTLTIAAAGTYNRCGPHTITIPLNSSVAFDVGTEIEFIQTSSAGHLLITSASAGVTLNSRHSLFSASGQFSAISCKKVDTNEWDIIGDLTR